MTDQRQAKRHKTHRDTIFSPNVQLGSNPFDGPVGHVRKLKPNGKDVTRFVVGGRNQGLELVEATSYTKEFWRCTDNVISPPAQSDSPGTEVVHSEGKEDTLPFNEQEVLQEWRGQDSNFLFKSLKGGGVVPEEEPAVAQFQRPSTTPCMCIKECQQNDSVLCMINLINARLRSEGNYEASSGEAAPFAMEDDKPRFLRQVTARVPKSAWPSIERQFDLPTSMLDTALFETDYEEMVPHEDVAEWLRKSCSQFPSVSSSS
jgi:hypothetical protein